LDTKYWKWIAIILFFYYSIGEVLVRPGKREFVFDSITESKYISVNIKYLINPTKRDYYLESRLYETDQFRKYNKYKNSKQVTIDGFVVDKPARIFENKFIVSGTWDYNPKDEFPFSIEEPLQKYSLGVEARSKTKLYSDDEFISHWEMIYGSYIDKARKEGMPDSTFKILFNLDDDRFIRAEKRFHFRDRSFKRY